MFNKCRKLIEKVLLFAVLLSFCSVKAQDYHFSQYYYNPVAVNPALSGAFDGVFRTSVITRTQWLSVTVPFLTFSANFDAAVYKNNRRQELVGLGVAINGDKAGDVSYKSVQAILTLSYIKNVGVRSRNKVGVGLYGGVVNNSFDPQAGTWDSQFMNGIFYPNLPSGENFEQVRLLYPDFGVGAFWSFTPSKTLLLRISAATSHINRPFYGFNETLARLPMRFSLNFNSQIALTREISLNPMFFANYQRNFQEYLLGTNIEYFKKKNSYTTLYTLGAGLFYRFGDALIFNGFVSWQNLKFAVAYDVNISPFVVATHARGGLEVAVSYVFKKKTIKKRGKEPCPYDIM